jgi:hypothetical protein
MADITAQHVRQILAQTVGPTPWYANTFPSVVSKSGKRFTWNYEGAGGPVAHVVSLSAEGDAGKPILGLNAYCRPFEAAEGRLGIWCPEGRSLRLACFDLDEMSSFDLSELAGWFPQSSERMYAKTAPVADMEVKLDLAAGTHKIEVPEALQSVAEIIAPTSYKALGPDDPAFALFVFYLSGGLVQVLPQRWFTASQYHVGYKWIPRAARDPDSQRILGECYGVGTFLLEEDGCRLDRWIEKTTQ